MELFSRKMGASHVAVTQEGDRYRVIWRQDGTKSRQKRFATLAQARAQADLWAIEVGNVGAAAAMAFSEADKRAVADFHAAVADWSSPPTLRDVIADFLARKKNEARHTVADACEARLDGLRVARASPAHERDVRLRLAKFAESFGDIDVRSVESVEIRRWLTGLRVGAQTSVNYLRVVGSIFELAIADGRLERNPCKGVATAKVRRGAPTILTRAQVDALLGHASRRLRPLLVLQAFCGLRRAEALRVDWSQIDFEEGHIDLAAAQAKTASRRFAPLPDVARAHLAPLAQDGPLGIGDTPYFDDLRTARLAAGIAEWSGNDLRHSFGSYRFALLGDAVAVAREMGNSPEMVHAHYKALVPKKAGEAYFA